MTNNNTPRTGPEQLGSLCTELENYIAYVEEHGTEPISRYNNNRETIENLESEARSLMVELVEICNRLEILGYL